MKKIAKDLQDRILNETGIISIIHIGKEKCDVLLGSGYSEDIADEEFERILEIVKEEQQKYPGKIEDSVCADIVAPDTIGYINMNGEFEVGVSSIETEDYFRVPDFCQLQYRFYKN